MLQDFKISFYVNSHVDKLFRKQKSIGKFITVGGIMRRDDGHAMVEKGNDGGGWSSNGVVLWLGRRQNRDAVEYGESGQC
jgi:methionine synthase II (cobalamin-independent)